MKPLYVIYFWVNEKNLPNKKITDVVMFDGASSVHIGGDPMKFYYPKLTIMRGVEPTFFFPMIFPKYQ